MMISLLHASLLVADTEISRRFYSDVIGLQECARPDLAYPGCWFEMGSQQLHLIELPNPDPQTGRPQHGGRDRHIAFSIPDLEALIRRLEGAGIAFTRSASGRAALFCRDPDANALEFVQA